MIKRGFIIDLTHILSMRMLIMPCPRALFESKFCITCSISFSVNVIFDKDVVKRELHYRPLSMIGHCLAKKEWNNSGFSLKFVTNLFSWKISGIQGIFYYYGKTLLLTNTFWDFRMVPLIFQINENNMSPLTLQWTPRPPSILPANSERVENCQSTGCCCCFF